MVKVQNENKTCKIALSLLKSIPIIASTHLVLR